MIVAILTLLSAVRFVRPYMTSVLISTPSDMSAPVVIESLWRCGSCVCIGLPSSARSGACRPQRRFGAALLVRNCAECAHEETRPRRHTERVQRQRRSQERPGEGDGA